MKRDEITAWITRLPPLPQTIQKMERLFAQTSIPSTDALVKIIESDPALTADILAFANSPLFSFASTIRSIAQAVVLFGPQQVRKMALKSAIFSSFHVDMSPYGISNDTFVKIASFQSELVFRWYMGVDIDKSKILIPLAFMMETGAIVLARYMLDNDIVQSFRHDLSFLELHEAEIRHTGMTTTQVDYILFEHWGLESIFAKALHALDNELYKADFYVEELAFALQCVRRVLNLKTQFEEETLNAVLEDLEAKGYESKKFLHACQSLQKKYETT